MISGNDVNGIIQDLMSGRNGTFIFSKPAAPFEYDALARQAAANQKRFLNTYSDSIVGIPSKTRIAALSSSFGLGYQGQTLLNTIMGLNSNVGMSLIGHHGANDAVNNIMSMSDSIAMARGGTRGGVFRPLESADNAKFAASQGGLAYKGLFNKDGSIDINQTHGINLPTAGYVIGRTLSDSSHYRDWAAAEKEKNSRVISDPQKLMAANKAIDNFADGTSVTEREQKSFQAHIKKFTEKINGFVASVSKMTGSYSEAINFMQEITGGNLFSSGQKADAARNRAMRMAANIRVAAADAGIDAPVLYGMMSHFKKAAGIASGLDERTITEYNPNSYDAQLSGYGAQMLANWTRDHKGEDYSKAATVISDKIAGYKASGMDKLNAYAAWIEKNGVDITGYEELAKSGRAEEARNFLENLTSRDAVNSFINSPGRVYLAQKDEATTNRYQQFAGLTLNYGNRSETVEIGKQKRFGTIAEGFAGALARGDDAMANDISVELDNSFRDNILSDEVLKQAGITDELAIKALKERSKYMSSQDILEDIGRLGGDSGLAARAARRMTAEKSGKDIAEKYTMSGSEVTSALDKLLNDKSIGISSESQADLRERANNMLAAGKSEEEVLDNLLKVAGSRSSAEEAMELRNKVTGGKGFKKDVDKAYNMFLDNEKRIDADITEKDMKHAAATNIISRDRKEIENVLNAALNGDENAQVKIHNMGLQAIKGEGGLEFRDDTVNEAIIKKFSGVSSVKDSTTAEKYMKAAGEAFYKAKNAGKTTAEAIDIMNETLKDKAPKDAKPIVGKSKEEINKELESIYLEKRDVEAVAGGTAGFISSLGESAENIAGFDINKFKANINEKKLRDDYIKAVNDPNNKDKSADSIFREVAEKAMRQAADGMGLSMEANKELQDKIETSLKDVEKGELVSKAAKEFEARGIKTSRVAATKQADKELAENPLEVLRTAEKESWRKNGNEEAYSAAYAGDMSQVDTVIRNENSISYSTGAEVGDNADSELNTTRTRKVDQEQAVRENAVLGRIKPIDRELASKRLGISGEGNALEALQKLENDLIANFDNDKNKMYEMLETTSGAELQDKLSKISTGGRVLGRQVYELKSVHNLSEEGIRSALLSGKGKTGDAKTKAEEDTLIADKLLSEEGSSYDRKLYDTLLNIEKILKNAADIKGLSKD